MAFVVADEQNKLVKSDKFGSYEKNISIPFIVTTYHDDKREICVVNKQTNVCVYP